MPTAERDSIKSVEQFMRRYFPKEYARRKREGRCVCCGAKRERPRPFSFPPMDRLP